MSVRADPHPLQLAVLLADGREADIRQAEPIGSSGDTVLNLMASEFR